MVVLGRIEDGGRSDLGHDPPPAVPALGALLGGESSGFLLGAVEEDRASVLRAHIQLLTVAGGRVVNGPEQIEQLVVVDLVWIEEELDGLGVSCTSGADLLVGRINERSPRVPYRGALDALHTHEVGLDAPEASRCKGGLAQVVACV